ncbi:GNAT family N-acetyltransferase [Pseudooceanicola sp. C21-150M6]|uniref:GNAT family N-acetyltransferase n=1 Tax=Pseudooceanicola sp. C21-150M6 TaxID=3434355 RepID=UPI003D7F7AEA
MARIVTQAYTPWIDIIGQKPGPLLDDYSTPGDDRTILLIGAPDPDGLIILKLQSDALMIDNIAISPESQGRGHLRRLLSLAERHARDAALPLLRLYTHVKMQRNRDIYAHFGFIETHIVEEAGRARVYMEKQLS